MTTFVDIPLLALLAITGFAMLRLRDLFGVAILSGIYSLLSAGLFVVMDAPDVAMTESAVGVGIATVLMLGALSIVGHKEKEDHRTRILPLAVVIVTGGILLYGITDLPPYGAADNPIQEYVVPRYIETMPEEIGVPNIVSAVLASYRGYDTMGETTVIFAAGIGVLLLLSGLGRGTARRREEEE